MSPRAVQSFHSAPGLHLPAVRSGSDPDRTAGHIFLTVNHAQQNGPMILNGSGQLVWFHRLPHGLAFNLQVQSYLGQKVLTWWQKRLVAGRWTDQEDVIMNHSYQPVAILRGAKGYPPDAHDFLITPAGMALVNSHATAPADLTAVGGSPRGRIIDDVIQELNIRTGQVLWTWRSLSHVPPSASYAPVASNSAPYDYFHLNSTQQLPDGNLLISARNTWAVYGISRQTGRIVWTLGGKRSNFRLGAGAGFEWQHDAHLSGGTLTLFDDGWNGTAPASESRSSALALKLNLAARTATLIHRYTHHPAVLSGSQGSAQTLPQGNIFVGWGSQPYFSEFTAAGKQIFDGNFPLGVSSYRALRFPWAAQPLSAPSLAVLPQPDGQSALYASWNGATGVAWWRVLTGASPSAVSWSTEFPRRGFETRMVIHGEPPYMSVEALDDQGRVLRTSAPTADPPHLEVFTSRAFVRMPSGRGEVPVGCLNPRSCRVSLAIVSDGSVVARTGHQPIPARRAGLVFFQLTRGARARLARTSKLLVTVRAADSSGLSARTPMRLIPYSVNHRPVDGESSISSGARVLGARQFVYPATEARVLVACYSAAPCKLNASLSADGHGIATPVSRTLGPEEVGDLIFALNRPGGWLLKHAADGQLRARVMLRDGRERSRVPVGLVQAS